MAWPEGMELVTVTVGASLNFFGDAQEIKVDVTPVIGGGAARLIWEATGQPVVAGVKSFYGMGGSVATFTVPNPDQPGFIDGAGNSVRKWAYSATVTVGNQRWVQGFQPVAGQTDIDLDLVKDGQVTAPVQAPFPGVTSINGKTGAVVFSNEGVFGPSAYDLAVSEGFIGSLGEWLDSLHGAPGTPGAPGASAYDTWLVLGNSGTEADFVASLKGETGDITPEVVAARDAAEGFADDAAQSATDAGAAKTDTQNLLETASHLVEMRGNVSGSLNLSAVNKNGIIHLTATGNITGVTLPGSPPPGRIITLVIKQDATGGRMIKLPGVALAWGASSDVVLSPAANSVDVLHVMWDGVRWVCLVAAQQIAIPANWSV